ncbi:hypothetical protein OAF63_06080, partial [Saprospiraceae bacterium]|nr:hypothetical protein [Saprospiraceae bacterium]
KLTNGNTYLGTVLSEDAETITIKTKEFPQITLRKKDIVSMKVIESNQLKEGEYWFENPNATRNLFGPTGYGLKKGEGYYQNFLLVYNSVSYGFTDNFTVGFGTIPFTFGDGLFFTITPKVSIPIVEDKFNIGVGLLYSSLFGSSSSIAYGVATYGSRDNNFTIGMGYGNIEGEWAEAPIFTFSGMVRLSKKFGLVTENWVIPSRNYNYEYGPNGYESSYTTSYNIAFTYSARLIFEGISVDIGFFNTPELAEYLPLGIPMAGITVPFGRK